MEDPSHPAYDTSPTIDTDEESDEIEDEDSVAEYEDVYLCAGDGSDCLDRITHQVHSISSLRVSSSWMSQAECNSELSDLCDFNFALHHYNDNLRFVVQHHPLLPDSARRNAMRKLHDNCVSFLASAMARILCIYYIGKHHGEGDCDHCLWKEYFQTIVDVRRCLWEALMNLARVDELIFAQSVNRAVPKSAKPSLHSARLLRDEALSWFVDQTSQLSTPYLRTCNKTTSMIDYAFPVHHSLPQARVSFRLRTMPDSAEEEIVSLKAIESHITHDNPVCAICHDNIKVPHCKDGFIISGASMDSACCKMPLHARCLVLWFREAISNDCCPLCRTKWSKDSVSRSMVIYITSLREQLKEASIARELGLRQTRMRQQSILAYVNGGRKPWWPLRQASLFRYFRGNPTRVLRPATLRLPTKTHDRKQLRITQLPSVIRKTRWATSGKLRIWVLKVQPANMLTQTSIMTYLHGKGRPHRQLLISSFLRANGGNAQTSWEIAAEGQIIEFHQTFLIQRSG